MFNEQTLPSLDSATLKHCELVTAAIKSAIERTGGAIRFDEFMRMALYEPGLGYYMAGARKFGESGDFVTAPELGSLFGAAVAAQCEQVLQTVEQPELLEFGGGSGKLAVSILSNLEIESELTYHIIELSPELEQRQKQYVRDHAPHLFKCIRWHKALPTEPISGCIIANEVLDALPVRSFVSQAGEVFECWVGVDESINFIEELRPADRSIVETLHANPGYEVCLALESYRFEMCSAVPAWIGDLGRILEKGLVLLIDYGDGRRERYGPLGAAGSLRSFLQHRVHDQVLAYPGGQDITASVDFTHVAEAAVDAGFAVSGFVDQTTFLTSCGILHKVADFQSGADEDTVLELNEQLKTLLLPTKMGTRFKVMGLTKSWDAPLLGFGTRDNRRAL
ncbi:MAG: SAM-dependent methyltransferase [Pseudomonadota bacterium]